MSDMNIVCGIRCMFWERLFACMRNWMHVCEVGACLWNGCLHVCGFWGACMRSWVHVWETVACMYAELGACMRNWVHVCGVGCMCAELGACLGNGPWLACGVGCLSGSRVLSQAPKLAPAPGPRPGPQWRYSVQQGACRLFAAQSLSYPGGLRPPDPQKFALRAPRVFMADYFIWIVGRSRGLPDAF